MNNDDLMVIDKLDLVSENTFIPIGWSFVVKPSEVIVVVGKNGIGKSTLLKTLSGIIKPHSGSVRLASDKTIAYVPQKIHLPINMPMSVSAFLELTSGDDGYLGMKSKLDIALLLNRSMITLSGGELQRVMICSCFSQNFGIAIMDEPETSLDEKNTLALCEIIEQFKANGKSFIISSHDKSFVLNHATHILDINEKLSCKLHDVCNTR